MISRPGTISPLVDVAAQHTVLLRQHPKCALFIRSHAASPLLAPTLTCNCFPHRQLGRTLARRATLRLGRCIPAPRVRTNGPDRQRRRTRGDATDRHDLLLLRQHHLAGDHSARLHTERLGLQRRLAPHRVRLGIVLVLDPTPANLHASSAPLRSRQLSGIAAARGCCVFYSQPRHSSGKTDESAAASLTTGPSGGLPASPYIHRDSRQKIGHHVYEKRTGAPLIRVTNLMVRDLTWQTKIKSGKCGRTLLLPPLRRFSASRRILSAMRSSPSSSVSIAEELPTSSTSATIFLAESP